MKEVKVHWGKLPSLSDSIFLPGPEGMMALHCRTLGRGDPRELEIHPRKVMYLRPGLKKTKLRTKTFFQKFATGCHLGWLPEYNF